MSDARDAVVIGGGHNGLIIGAYLAKAGARALVLEARSKTGGCTDTSSPWPEHPGFKVTTYSYVVSLMPPAIVRELDLRRHGYRIHPIGPYYQAFPDGRSISIDPSDPKVTYESVARFSKKDADALERMDEWLAGIARFVKPLTEAIPLNLGSSPGPAPSRSGRDPGTGSRTRWRSPRRSRRTSARPRPATSPTRSAQPGGLEGSAPAASRTSRGCSR